MRRETETQTYTLTETDACIYRQKHIRRHNQTDKNTGRAAEVTRR